MRQILKKERKKIKKEEKIKNKIIQTKKQKIIIL